MGYLPLVWVALGLILNGAAISVMQGFFSILFPTWAQVAVPAGSAVCEIIGKRVSPLTGADVLVVAPSHWMGAATFFAVFSIYNSIRVALRPAVSGASQEKVDVRRAFSLSVMVIGIIFMSLVFARGFSGCETWLGGILGVLFGGGIAIGYWHLLDACNTGMVPDVLQVIGSMAPAGTDTNIPIICTPPK
jgi:hypothetical protein